MVADYAGMSILIVLLLVAVVTDINCRRIPNILIASGLVLAVAVSAWSSGLPGVVHASAGALVGFLLMLPLYLMRVMGAGDVKLCAVVGAFMGPLAVIGSVLLTWIAGGCLAIAVALLSKRVRDVIANLKLLCWWAVSKTGYLPGGSQTIEISPTGRLPYAIAIAAGTILQIWLASRGGWFFS